ncbi:MAG: FHA domain-containing protein [Sulfuritalea sp.]|nr:FHA domain-containing protein [Sulfuritalea sp.]
MLKHYVFWGLFALVMLGVVVTVLRQRRSDQRRSDQQRAASVAKAGVAAASVSSSPVAKPVEAAFDPGATRVHFRGAPSDRPASSLEREEATLPAEASAKLVCVSGAQKGNSFPVAAAGISVGRHQDNDIVIVDPRVSFHHAWVGVIDRKAVLRDLESTNGTFLNGKINAPVREAVLSHGDTIFFGGHSRDQFLFVVN